MTFKKSYLRLIALSFLLTLLTVQANVAASSPINFNTQIRPILTQHCSSCHGGVKQAGRVSFVYPDQILPPDGWVVEPGDPEGSLLIERIRTDDPDMRMPPVDEHPDGVPPEQVALLQQWIAEGAKWTEHWSMTPLNEDYPPTGSPSQTKSSESWARQPLDHYVHVKRQQHGLNAAPDAPPAQWLRRATLDLIGLPPSPEHLEMFEQACATAENETQREAVYSDQVDRLLASEHFGERWATVWMDLARYADSKGFEKDPHRDMWPYRDWLIRAFNRDMPYDEFTIKQIAGDLLPEPTADDLIATAFHRNTQTNTEGGTDDEEFRVAAVIDRVNTTWTLWQATTFGCVQCHAHPYDPYQHDEYYQVLALFNNTLDADLDSDFPTMKIPTEADAIETAFTRQREYASARTERNQLGVDLASQTPWNSLTPRSVETTGGKLKIFADEVRSDGGTFPVGVTYTVQLAAEEPACGITALRIDILPLRQDPASWPEQGSLLSHLVVEHVDAEGNVRPVELADAFADAIASADDPRACLEKNAGGVGGFPKLAGPRQAYIVLKRPIALLPAETLRVQMTHSASTSGSVATPIRRFQWHLSTDSRWSDLLNSETLAVSTKQLQQSKQAVDAIKGAALPVVAERPERIRRDTRMFVRGNWLERGEQVQPGIPSVFVNSNRDEAIIVNDRLQFARWLVSVDNPLAARVWANRLWQQLFGMGLVETLEDFGSSGLSPSNPLLLDHLAIRISQTHRWHLKPFLREIVLSSTYRQDNRAAAEEYQRDPQNEYLCRGPRTRLTAEMVRDQALSVSGLLTADVGGPSVMPPQPEGIWQTVYSGAKWKTPEDESRYRRALYTYWRRTSPYPSFLLFDSPTRDLCSARRIDTNTPLQALVTLNDPVYVECAEMLAQRAMRLFGGEQTADACQETAVSQELEASLEAESAQEPGCEQEPESAQEPESEQETEAALETGDAPALQSVDWNQAMDWIFTAATQQKPSRLEQSELRSLFHDLQADGLDPQPALAIVAGTILNLDKALTK